ncbi:hypothetical protein D3C80_576350 [compost metagenome]
MQAGIVLHPVGKLAEGFGLRIDRALEDADGGLVIVAGVDDDGIRIGDQLVPVARLDIGADDAVRIDIRHAHGDDLFLELHLQPHERHVRSAAFLVLQRGKFRLGAQEGEHGVNARIRPGNGAVDAFGGKQQRALDAVLLAELEQRLAQALEPRQAGEMIKRGHKEITRGFRAGENGRVGHGR